jgi:hypothetical protein
MINKKLLFPLILILFAHVGFSQTIETKTESDISAETKKQAVEFLREAAAKSAICGHSKIVSVFRRSLPV